MKSVAGTREDYAHHEMKAQFKQQNDRVCRFATSNARVEEFKPGGEGGAQDESISSQHHAYDLARHVGGDMMAPGSGGLGPAIVNVLVDSSSGVT